MSAAPRRPFARTSTSTAAAFALAAVTAAAPWSALAQDSDGDGVPDAADARPCDASIAGLAYAPAEAQYGLILLEDNWPDAQSDEDFNDAAIAYNYVYELNGSNRVTRVRATLSPLAAGGFFAMGLGLHLPIPRSAVQSVTLSTGGGAAVPLTPSAIDDELTVQLVGDLATLFGNATRPINSQSGTARAAAQALVVDIRLSTPVPLFTSSAPHDIYIFQTLEPAHEIHGPSYPGTAGVDRGMFGLGEDGSSEGHWFVDTNGLPSALVLPLGTAYPRELVRIGQLFPRIGAWAASGGTTDADFYLNDTVTSHGYADVNGNGPLTPAALAVGARDVTCVATERPVTSAVTITDANLSTYAGTRLSVAAGVTVTINTSTPLELYSLDLAGTITSGGCSTGACTAVDLRVAADANIRSTGVIQTDGRGYLGNLQSGNGYVGRTYGNAAVAGTYAGGSHGGYGGHQSAAPAPPYGDFLHPVHPGGGGTSQSTSNGNYAGGNGGGTIRLTAGGVLTLNGRVRANGARGAGNDSGGAGGSVWLAGSQVNSSVTAGTVIVQANGSYGYFSGGGGGRVAIYGTPTGTFDPVTMAQAIGGAGGNYGAGGPGTLVYGYDVTGQQRLHLASANLNSGFANTQLGAYGTITAVNATTLTTGTWLQPGSLVGRTLIADAEGSQTFAIVANTANTITVSGGSLTGATAVGRSFCVSDYELASLTVAGRTDLDLGCVTVGGTLRVQDSATLDVFRAVASRFELANTAQMSAYDITGATTELRNTSRLTVRGLRGTTGTLFDSAYVTGWAPSTSRYFPVTLTFADLTMSSSSRIDTDSLGFLGNLRSGNGYTGRTNGNVESGATAYAGGSHGGYGGIQAGAPPMLYGDVQRPVTPGAGGTSQSTSNANYAGGNGGGVLRVDVSGTFTLDGRITANGGRGAGNDSGGAGGSIWVSAGTLARTTAGLAVQASGSYGYFSGGGGGRIALHYGALGGTWAIDATSVQAYGGAGGNYGAGGSGTILDHRADQPVGRLLITAPSGMVSNYARTRIGVFGTVTAVNASVLTTSAPMEAGTLVGRTLRPDAEQAATFTIVANTANTITVEGTGLNAATAAGRTFAVADFHTDYDDVVVEGAATVDLGRFQVAGGLTIRNGALVDFSELDVATLDIRDTSQLFGRAIVAGAMTQRNSSRLTVRSVRAQTLALTESAVITGWAPTTANTYVIAIDAGAMSMTSSTLITADGLGYLGSINSGSSSAARTNGNVLGSASAYAGGSHGGHGGIQSGVAPASYDSPLAPSLPGGGGTSQFTSNGNYAGGTGGGVIRVVVAGNLTLDGRITAAGVRGAGNDSGGAGGAVWIDAGTITRNTVSGFAVEANGSYGYFSGGGGGRVALYYDALVGWAIGATNVRAVGGAGGNYGVGGAGTVVYQPRAQARPNLLMTAPAGYNSNYMRTRLGVFGTVTSVSGAVLNTGTVLEPGTLVGRTLVANVDNEAQTFTIVANTASSITADATLVGATVAGAEWYVQGHQNEYENVILQGDAEVVAGLLDVSNTMIMEGTSDLAMATAQINDLTVRGTGTRIDGRRVAGNTLRFTGSSVSTLRGIAGTTVLIDNSAVITGYAATLSAVYPITIAADDLTITASARVHADSLGYLGGLRNGNGWQGRTNGNVAGAVDATTGGSHGGRGGAQGAGNAAAVYGSSTQPSTAGGGGTSLNTSNGNYASGNGGGVIRIVVGNRFSHDGVISVGGGRGAGNDSGGAGGSIWVTAGVMASTTGGGRFDALGSYGYYSGGAGGRIAVQAGSTSGWTGSASTMRAAGGSGGNYGAGGVGTTVFSGL